MLQILSKNCLHTLRRAHFTSPVSFISIWPLKVCHFALYKQKGLMGHPVFSTLSSLLKPIILAQTQSKMGSQNAYRIAAFVM